MEAIVYQLNTFLLGPAGYLLEPSKRLFWLFLLSALALASITVAVQQGRFSVVQQLGQLFNRQYWFNRSTCTDLLMVLVNNLIRILVVVPLLGSHLAATIWVGSLLQTTFGDAPTLAVPYVAIGLLYTVCFFLLEDVSRFGLHMAMHKIPHLWYFHRLHHSATTLTPVTVHRVHPVEMALYYTRGLVVFGVVSGVFIYFFKNQVHGWEILGVDCLGFAFNFLGANLRHSHIRLSFGRFERWFISPMQHQVHHSKALVHHDKNFGTCLAIWDRCAKTWLPAKGQGALTFGLAQQQLKRDSVNSEELIPNLAQRQI
ncbi:sterol desaturase family protein [Halioxenophilus aromaticivorans]|uniref:Fatty acid hydroxylase domain-containing protein n=1 Tax=Halioxenophilus aromaticivorans TaxID=1306992 RepID=A0AAV3U7L0_9ALTE